MVWRRGKEDYRKTTKEVILQCRKGKTRAGDGRRKEKKRNKGKGGHHEDQGI